VVQHHVVHAPLYEDTLDARMDVGLSPLFRFDTDVTESDVQPLYLALGQPCEV
jgi:hypothetical protein